MLDSLPAVFEDLTISELEKRFAGKKHDHTNEPSKFKIEILTVLEEIELAIEGCKGATFFEHVIAGVTILSEEDS
jgi:hypothetical protein